MTVRAIAESEVPALRELAIRIFRDTFSVSNTPQNMETFLRDAYSLENFQKEFKEPGALHFFAVDNDVPAGYLRLRINPEVDHYLGKNHIELHRLYVDVKYQSKQVGSTLMQYALDLASQKKYDWIWLGVWEHNPKAQKFYGRWGFERFSEHSFQMGDETQTDWLLKRKIS